MGWPPSYADHRRLIAEHNAEMRGEELDEDEGRDLLTRASWRPAR